MIDRLENIAGSAASCYVNLSLSVFLTHQELSSDEVKN